MSSYESNPAVTKACTCGDKLVHSSLAIGQKVCRDVFTQGERLVGLRDGSGVLS